MKKTLAEMVREKRASEPPAIRCVEKSSHAVSMLTASPWGAGAWLLPWYRLESIHFVPSENEGDDRLEMKFSHYQVIASGENFASFQADLHGGKVRMLRNLPPSHRAGLRLNEPFISRLEVTAFDASESCSLKVLR